MDARMFSGATKGIDRDLRKSLDLAEEDCHGTSTSVSTKMGLTSPGDADWSDAQNSSGRQPTSSSPDKSDEREYEPSSRLMKMYQDGVKTLEERRKSNLPLHPQYTFQPHIATNSIDQRSRTVANWRANVVADAALSQMKIRMQVAQRRATISAKPSGLSQSHVTARSSDLESKGWVLGSLDEELRGTRF